MEIANQRICFFDSEIIDEKNTTATRLQHSPTKQGFCAEFNEPWEGDIAFPNFVFDGEKWRMYYMAGVRIDMERISKIDPNDKKKLQAVIDETIADGFKICYMESEDGISWKKPTLKICEFRGSNDNNIILRKPVEFFVFKDENPNCLEEERYKAIYQVGYKLYAMYSADGLRFTDGGVIMENGGTFDSLNTVRYDSQKGQYVAYVRGMHRYDGKEYPDIENKKELPNYLFPEFDKPEELKKYLPEYVEGEDKLKYDVRRDIRVAYSTDFKVWTRPERIRIKGEEDGLTQYYTNCISVYPRAPQYLIGFPNRYNDDRVWNKSYDNLCGLEARKIRASLQERFGLAITDCIFISSKDGINWEKSDGAFLRPGIERKDGWLYGDCYFACGIIETKNELYGHREYSLYSPEGIWGHKCRLMRYTLRLDGFVSYNAKGEEKVITTKPFVYQGKQLLMNLSTSAVGCVKVILTDKDGEKIESAEIFGDDTDKEVWFEDEQILEKWQNREVVMQIVLREADVYSFQFCDKK